MYQQYKLVLTRIIARLHEIALSDPADQIVLTREGDTWEEILNGMILEGMITQEQKATIEMILSLEGNEAGVTDTFANLEGLKSIVNPVLSLIGADELNTP